MIKTSEKVEVLDYPWGFRLRTTLYNFIEFDKKKGYRLCTQTIDPKTGRLCAPKKSTYYRLIVRYYNEDGHIKALYFSFNGVEEINKAAKFISENIELFDNNELQYFYSELRMFAIVSLKAMVVYCGSKFEDVKPLFNPFIELCEKGLSDGRNYFNELHLDYEAIEATKDVNYKPFG